MNDYTANTIVFLILIFIVIGILLVLNTIGKAYMYGKIVGLIKNNSGNYSATNIVMLVGAIGAAYFLIYWLFMPKTTIHQIQNKEN
jgi:hypothetical protein